MSASVTVCIPLYNHASTVERALRSVLGQDHDDFDILVVDDASADEGAAIARDLLRPRDRVVVNESRLGAARNHNRCIDLADGRLIQFVHGDDELLPGALSALAATFTRWTDVALAFAPRRVVTDDDDFASRFGTLHGQFRGLAAINDADDLIAQTVLKGALANWFGEPTSVMFEREGARRAGGFTPDLVQAFDFDLWLHMSAGRRIAFVDRELAVRHHHGNTLSQANTGEAKHWLDHTRLLSGLVGDPVLSRRVRGYAGLWLLSSVPSSLYTAVDVPRGNRRARLGEVVRAPAVEFRRRR